MTQLMTGCIQTANDLPFREKKPDLVSSVQAYINENYQQEVTLDCLAQYFSINKYHLQKYFKRYTGLSPNDYLTRIRLDRAKRLLRTTSDPVIEIAHEVGYTVTYFDNIFKKNTRALLLVVIVSIGTIRQTSRQRIEWYTVYLS